MENKALQAGDLSRLRWAGDAQLSPDGDQVAWVETALDVELDRPVANIPWAASAVELLVASPTDLATAYRGGPPTADISRTCVCDRRGAPPALGATMMFSDWPVQARRRARFRPRRPGRRPALGVTSPTKPAEIARLQCFVMRPGQESPPWLRYRRESWPARKPRPRNDRVRLTVHRADYRIPDDAVAASAGSCANCRFSRGCSSEVGASRWLVRGGIPSSASLRSSAMIGAVSA